MTFPFHSLYSGLGDFGQHSPGMKADVTQAAAGFSRPGGLTKNRIGPRQILVNNALPWAGSSARIHFLPNHYQARPGNDVMRFRSLRIVQLTLGAGGMATLLVIGALAAAAGRAGWRQAGPGERSAESGQRQGCCG